MPHNIHTLSKMVCRFAEGVIQTEKVCQKWHTLYQ